MQLLQQLVCSRTSEEEIQILPELRGKNGAAMTTSSNPLKAIREKCLNCCCYQQTEVKECPMTSCALHPFRMGKNPFRKKTEMTEERKQAMAQRLAENRRKKAEEES